MGEVGVGDVGALPGQDAEEAEEHHDAELEDVLYAVDLEVWGGGLSIDLVWNCLHLGVLLTNVGSNKV